MKLLRRKTKAAAAPEKESEAPPSTPAEFVRRAYARHAHGDHQAAEQDLRAALGIDSGLTEAYFALGLTLKALGRTAEATQAFQKVLANLENQDQSDIVRSHMLARLTRGHINQLTQGDWNLYDEFWKKGG